MSELLRSDILVDGESLKNGVFPDHIVKSFSNKPQPDQQSAYEDAMLETYDFPVDDSYYVDMSIEDDEEASYIEDALERGIPTAIDFKKINLNKYAGLHEAFEPVGTEELDREANERTTRAQDAYHSRQQRLADQKSRAEAHRTYRTEKPPGLTPEEYAKVQENQAPKVPSHLRNVLPRYRREQVRPTGQGSTESTTSEQDTSFASLVKEHAIRAKQFARKHAINTFAVASAIVASSSLISAGILVVESRLEYDKGDKIYSQTYDNSDEADDVYAEAARYRTDSEELLALGLGTLMLGGLVYAGRKYTISIKRK